MKIRNVRFVPRTIAALAALHCALLVATSASAELIVTLTSDVSTVPVAYQYQYLIDVDPASSMSIIDFGLEVSAASDLQNIVLPANWVTAYQPGDILFYAFSLDAPDDIPPGGSAEVSFTSIFAPGVLSVSLSGLDPNTFEFESYNDVAASPVPEPSSWCLGSFGAMLAVLVGGRRRVVAICAR